MTAQFLRAVERDRLIGLRGDAELAAYVPNAVVQGT
jgi:hypothetical protein